VNRIDLAGRIAVVTGGSSGIGFATATRMAVSGATVVLWDVNAQGIESARAKLPGADGHAVDITDERAVMAAAERTLADHGRIDILVNSAGIAGDLRPVVEFPAGAWRRVIEVNLVGTFLCCKAVVPSMQQRDYGRIVNLSSTAGKDGNAFVSAYAASKAGVMAFTKSLGKELATTGIRVNCLTPAMIETELVKQMTPQRIETALARIPMGRAGRPEEVAAMICWMASDECSFTTGATFDISGGRSTY
jgi:3-oxoacyl-[acyl-carrier protein] reductase